MLAELGTRAHDLHALCLALSDHINAWQVFSEATPYYASVAVANAKTDLEAIHKQSAGTAPPCLKTYSADLKRMGVLN